MARKKGKKEKKEMAKVVDFKQTAPYDAEYRDIMSLIGQKMTIIAAEGFSNKNGKGVHILVQIEGKEYRLCTHAVAIVDFLTREEVQNCLQENDYFYVTLVQTPSESDKNRKVLRFEDVEDETA